MTFSAPQPTGAIVVATDRGTIVGPAGNPFNMPTDVAVGRDGRVYVLDGVNNRVVVYDPEGRRQFEFGTPGSAPGQFAYPLGIATDPDGKIYVADSGNHRFQVFTADGKPLTAISLPATASGPPPDPAGVAVDPSRGRLYLADNDNHCIQVYNLAEHRFETVWGGPGQGERQFRFPFLIDVSAQGYLLVVEPINTRVQVLNPEGKFVGFIGAWGIEAGQLFRPKGVALWRDRVFVTDSYLGSIQIFDLAGRFLGTLADADGTILTFNTPTGIATDEIRNRLYVVELKASQVRRLDLATGTGKLPARTGPLGLLRPSSPLPIPSPPSPSRPGDSGFPNSSRECAICHVRWVQAFSRNESPEGPMHDVLERKAGSGDMCLSCHDGSVADSRFKVWSTRHHTTDVVPSPAVHIPTEVFPLDNQGRMTCATCHTAHAVQGDSDLRTVIFLRRPNVDSSLCLSCHPEHAQKSDRHHPLGHRDEPIPQVILDAGGRTSADGHSIICQTCHEPHGARNAWMLVLPPSQLCTACHTDKAPEIAPPNGAPVHRIGHTYNGFEPPQNLLEQRATFGPKGELTCLSCHRLHDASGVRPLLIRGNQDSALCQECHEKEKAVLGSPHDLRLSSPETVNAHGQTAAASGPCGACHRIHGWARQVPATDEGRMEGTEEGKRVSNSESPGSSGGPALPTSNSQLHTSPSHPPHSSGCLECHETPGPGSGHRLYEQAHPVGVPVSQDLAVPLPLDPASRAIGCLTCHDPHVPRPPGVAGSTGEPREKRGTDGGQGEAAREGKTIGTEEGEKARTAEDRTAVAPSYLPTPSPSASNAAVPSEVFPAPGADFRFLRRPGSELCTLCHEKLADARHGFHDPARFTPAQRETLGVPSSVGSCRVCHTAHSAQGPHLWARAPVGESGSPSALCHACHNGESVKKPRETHHPLGTFDGKDQTSDSSVQAPAAIHRQDELPRWAGDGGSGDPNAIEVSCTSCHDPHAGTATTSLAPPEATRNIPESVCLNCHQDKGGIKGSVHDPATSAWAKNLGFVSRNLCLDCHPIHTPQDQSGMARRLAAGNRAATLCEACHRPGGPGPAVRTPHLGRMIGNGSVPGDPPSAILIEETTHRKSPIRTPPSGAVDAFHLSTNILSPPGIADSSPGQTVRCTTCHDIHQGRSDRKLLRAPRQDSTLCLTCHADRAPVLRTVHNLAQSAPATTNTRGESAAASGSCGVCHLVHPPTADGETWALHFPSGENRARGLCTGCHGPGGSAAKRVPAYTQHPAVTLLNRHAPGRPDSMPTFDEQARPSPTGTILCPTCHQIHAPGMVPATPEDPTPSVSRFLRTSSPTLCADCHGPEALWRFLYYHQADRNPHPVPP